MTGTRTGIAALALAGSLIAGPAAGQLYESRSPFGAVNVAPPQTAIVAYESLLGAGSFVRLARYPEDNPGRRLSRAVGRLDFEYQSGQANMCTATVIAPEYLLTNHHCIPGIPEIVSRTGPVIRARLLMNYYDEADTGGTASYPVEVAAVETSARLDYSILRVAGDPSRRFGRLSLPVAEPLPNEPFIMFHHPSGLPLTLSAKGCRTAARPIDVDGQLLHYCDTLPGSSGALLLDVSGTRLIGLHFAGRREFNLAMPLSRLRRASPLLAQLFPDQSPPPVRPPDSGTPPIPTPRMVVPTAGSTWTDPVSGVEFVLVPGGSYEMGCGSWSGECESDEKPLHRVTVGGFWLGRTEVTQAQWQQVMGSNLSYFQKGGTYPVEQVSWNDAQAFIRKLNGRGNGTFRLPSEAEWEYACRSGGRPELYCGGSSVDGLAWYSGNSGGTTHPVGQKQRNGFGLADMSGNVWEWLEDCWHDSYNGTPSDGRAWTEGNCYARVLRGGSWDYTPRGVRSAYRGDVTPVTRGNAIGFRLARTLNP